MEFSDLTEDQRQRARACKSPDELAALAESEGVTLTDEQLEAVAGGSWNSFGCGKNVCSDKFHYR